MCGIVGIIGERAVAPLLVDGLRRLEYRGYDSTGIATLVEGHIQRQRAEGKLANLESRLADMPLGGRVGIGHTRWATHGAPTETNAHPHATARVAVVHNGIIENYQELKAELLANGHVFASQTDTEIVAHLVDQYLQAGLTPIEAASASFKRLTGAYSLVLLFAGHDELMIGARRGTPLAVGLGEGEMFLASDAIALAPFSNRICYLEDGDWVVVRRNGFAVFDAADKPVERPIKHSRLTGAMVGKGNFHHFMQKEIFEQTEAVADTLNSYVHPSTGQISLPPLPFDLANVPRVTIVACGTASYAGLVGKYWLEQIARVPVEVDIASEFRYREAPMPVGGVALFVSQSGETLDTLEALRYCRRQGQHIISIVNVPESTISRESDVVLPTLAGPEIGVASTKAFTTQLCVLACFTLAAARARGTLDQGQVATLSTALRELPARIGEALHLEPDLRTLAKTMLADARDVLYLGRGSLYPIALEGALKLKEISYIHAEGYAAGELKHGPIALIDETVPVVVLALNDRLIDKALGNIQEVAARGGRVILIGDAETLRRAGTLAHASFALPAVHPFVAPILAAVPVQLLAYHTAVWKGTDVDQPRNLAKSVTVE